ncbi:MAG: hypothetical protein SGI98_09390 [Verrucomicrobiota bacterium]|nr:hypothetical protein [Verrucomicrobiota bacterium]
MKRLFFLIILFGTPVFSHADEIQLPPPVRDGLKALIDKGAQQAVNIWVKGTPVEKDAKLTTSLLQNLEPMIAMMGNVNGYEIVRQVQISPSVVTSYIVIKLDLGPIYMVSDAYQSKNGWIIANIRFDGNLRPLFSEDFIIDLYDQAQKK